MSAFLTAVSSLLSFQIIWNVPSQPCLEKFKIDLNLSAYRVIQNENRKFIGDRIALFYDLGIFPEFVRNEGGNLVAINGGIPQKGDIILHLEKVRNDIAALARDDFSGKLPKNLWT